MNDTELNATELSATELSDKFISVSKLIEAEASTIFGLLADPSRHHEFDGSGTVISGADSNPKQLDLGARFGMSMKLGVPYQMSNEVVEFEQDQLIAWRHFGHHVWRYELREQDGGTLVTESFDWGAARFPSKMYELLKHPQRNKANIAKTLDQLALATETS